MKQLTYAEASWLLGDDAADAVIEYAVALGRSNGADSVELNALNRSGNVERVTFLVGPATMLTAETTATTFTEPDNSVAIAEIRERISRMPRNPSGSPSGNYAPSEYIEDL